MCYNDMYLGGFPIDIESHTIEFAKLSSKLILIGNSPMIIRCLVCRSLTSVCQNGLIIGLRSLAVFLLRGGVFVCQNLEVWALLQIAAININYTLLLSFEIGQ